MRHEVITSPALSPALRVAHADQPLALAIIIPTFNESANVRPLLDKLSRALIGLNWEAVFVDDNSPDGTADLVRQIGLTNRNVRVVHRIGRRGLSTAVVEGMLATSAPVLAVIDGDMQHDETILPQLVAKVTSGDADLAIGTRYAGGGSLGEWDTVSDPMSGYFVLSRSTLMAAMPKMSGVGFKILLDIISSAPTPLRIAEVPYTFRVREAGESKIGALVAIEYGTLLLDKTIGRYIPVRMLNFLAVGGLGVGVHMATLATALAVGLSFLPADIVAVMVAMTFNFVLNNTFTYRDRQLKGWKMLRGLLTFCAVCSVGGIANIGIGTWLHGQDSRWWLAGMAGVVVGAVWNFAASSVVTWKK
jgi:dolichol-phosphate mannosyltransferase